jgi:hypothetical protein
MVQCEAASQLGGDWCAGASIRARRCIVTIGDDVDADTAREQ